MWHDNDVSYFLSSNDHVTGPYSREELEDSLKYGVISSGALICREGTDDWQTISSLFEDEKPRNGLPTLPPDPSTPFTELQRSNTNAATVYQQYYNPKSPGVAVLLEILPGLFLQTFGIGNLYAGNIGAGLALMLTYWLTVVVNFLLLFVLIGFITWPLTFLIYLIVAIITSQRSAERSNWEKIMTGKRAPVQLPG